MGVLDPLSAAVLKEIERKLLSELPPPTIEDVRRLLLAGTRGKERRRVRNLLGFLDGSRVEQFDGRLLSLTRQLYQGTWSPAIRGARGGHSRSPAKIAASQRNGRLGGRPRKQQAAPQDTPATNTDGEPPPKSC